jgi:hypothetical protein
MAWRKMIAASLFTGTMAGSPTSFASDRQCGESALIGKQPLSAAYVWENAELRGVPPQGSLARLENLAPAETAFPFSMGVDIDRSLYIRDAALLDAFSFAEVMDTLAAGLGENSPSGIALFQDWWRTTAPAKPQYAGDIGCTDTLINGFSYTCPDDGSRSESSLQKVSDLRTGRNGGPPFTIIALINRGDLASNKLDGGTCGEYRIIAAAETTPGDLTDDLARLGASGKFYLSFEAALPNSKEGMCLAVQRFWKSLALKDDENAKHMLRIFFLEKAGLTGEGTISSPPAPEADFTFGPVMGPANLGMLPEDAETLGTKITNPIGQIRTNTRSTSPAWLLRQYSFRKTSLGFRITPTALSSTPPVQIMDSKFKCSIGGKNCDTLLAEEISTNRDGLTTNQITALSFTMSDNCLTAGQMVADSFRGDGYVAALAASASANSRPVWETLKQLANRTESSLIPMQIAQNLQMTSCAGCHRHSTGNQIDHLVTMPGNIPINQADFPVNDFTHARIACEKPGQNGHLCERYDISPLLRKVLLPWRAYVMEQTLLQR